MRSKYLLGAAVSATSWALHFGDAPWAETFLEYMSRGREFDLVHLLFSGWAGYVAALPSFATFTFGFLKDPAPHALAVTAINCMWLGVITVGTVTALKFKHESRFWKGANLYFTYALVVSLTLHPSLFSITTSAYFGIIPAFIWCLNGLTSLENRTEREVKSPEISSFIIAPLFIAALSKPSLIILPIAIVLFLRGRRVPAIILVVITFGQLILSNARQSESVLNIDALVSFASQAHFLIWNSAVFAGGAWWISALLLVTLVAALLVRVKEKRNAVSSLSFFLTTLLFSLFPWIAYKESALSLSETAMKSQYLAMTWFILFATAWLLVRENARGQRFELKYLSAGAIAIVISTSLAFQFKESRSIDTKGISFAEQEEFFCKITAPLPGWDLQLSDSLGGSIWSNCAHQKNFSSVIRNGEGEIVGFVGESTKAIEKPEWTLTIYPRALRQVQNCIPINVFDDLIAVSDSDPFLYGINENYSSDVDKETKCRITGSDKEISIGRVFFYNQTQK